MKRTLLRLLAVLVRAALRQWRSWARSQHQGMRGREPGEPGQAGGLRPNRKGVGGLEEAAKGLEGGHGLQVDRDLLGVALRRPPVHDLDVETRQVSVCLWPRPKLFKVGSEI